MAPVAAVSVVLLGFVVGCDSPTSLQRCADSGGTCVSPKRDGGGSKDAGGADKAADSPAPAPDTATPEPDGATASKLAKGMACNGAAQCLSGFCVDGVCCESACAGTCMTCSPGGTCAKVAAGQDPRNQCAMEAASTCGKDGMCDGAGACRTYAANTSCKAASCANGTETGESKCNGMGTCVAGAMKTCAPFICGVTGCDTPCSGANGCAPGYACAAGQCKDLTAGLVAYWKFDEGTGTNAADSSGNGNDLMLTNGATWTSTGFAAAKFTNKFALQLDGVDDTAVNNAPNATLDFGTGSFSYSVWVYVTGNTGAYDMPLYTGGASAGNPGYDIELGDGGWATYVGDDTATVGTGIAGSPMVNQWVHIVGVRDAQTNQVRSYVNGTLYDTQSGRPGSVNNVNGLWVGSGINDHFFQGTIDDVRLYNRALSADEAAALAGGQ